MSDHKFGWVPDLPDQRDNHLSIPRPRALPPSVDLRSGMPPPYDQGQLGSCTAQAIAGIMEFCRIRQRFHLYTPSRLFIYYNERVMEGTVGSDAGAMIRDGIKSVNSIGACAEEMWTYDPAKFTQRPGPECYAVSKYDAVLSYARVPQTKDTFRAQLAGGFPFCFGFTVYESFESAEVARTGVMLMPTRSEAVLGGHAVVAVGYDDARRMLLVRNSWGDGWGLGGYFWMPYDYATNPDLADDFWHVDLVGLQRG